MRKTTHPQISVIIPTYNRASFLPGAINSVLRQTYSDFEIIIIDDYSIDDTKTVIDRFKDDRILYIKHDHNRGVAAARNSGLVKAQGKYIAFIDDDDAWLSQKLEKQVEAFQDAAPDIGIVYTKMYWVRNKIRIYVPEHNSVNRLLNKHLEPVFLYLQACLIKKECFEKVGGFDEKFRMAEDFEMHIRLSEYYKYKYINIPLTIVYKIQGSLTDNIWLHTEYYIKALNKNMEYIKNNRVLHAALLFQIGYHVFSCGKTREQLRLGRAYIFKAAITDPAYFKYIIVAIASLFGANIFKTFVVIYNSLRNRQSTSA